MATPIRVQVCDDNATVRSAIRRLLEIEPDVIVIGEAASAQDAIIQLRASHPDVLLLDVTMPGRSGLEALPDLRAASPRTRIIVLSLHADPVYARHALAIGAHGYLAKDAAAELTHAVRNAVAVA